MPIPDNPIYGALTYLLMDLEASGRLTSAEKRQIVSAVEVDYQPRQDAMKLWMVVLDMDGEHKICCTARTNNVGHLNIGDLLICACGSPNVVVPVRLVFYNPFLLRHDVVLNNLAATSKKELVDVVALLVDQGWTCFQEVGHLPEITDTMHEHDKMRGANLFKM